MNTTLSFRKIVISYSPFWVFLWLFKFSAWLHYTLLSSYGEQILPLWIVWILIGMTSFLQLVFDIPAWRWLDRFGYIRMLKITTIFFILAWVSLSFGLTRITYFTTLLCSMAWRLFFAPGINAYVLSKAPKEHAGAFMSLKEIWESIWMVLVWWLLAFATSLSPSIIWVSIAFLLIVWLILLYFAPLDTVSAHAEKKLVNHHYYLPKKEHSIRRILRDLNPVSTVMVLSSFWSAFFYSLIWFVIPLLITQVENGKILSLWLWVFDLAVVLLGFFIWKLADAYNKKLLIMIWLLIFTITWITIWFNLTVLFLFLGFLATTWDELADISLWAWLDNIEKTHAHDGKLSGIPWAVSDLWWTIWPMIAWFLYPILWPSRTISIWGGVLFVILLSYYILLAIYDKEWLRSILPRISKKPHKFRHKR